MPDRSMVTQCTMLHSPLDYAIKQPMSIAKLEIQLRRWLTSKDAPAITTIARETGLSLRWLQYYRDGKIKSPGLRNLVTLWDYSDK